MMRMTAICVTSARRSQPARRSHGRRRLLRSRRRVQPPPPRAYRAAGATVICHQRRAQRAEHHRRLAGRHTWRLAAVAVVSHGADLGLAHDGDADRCLAVDATCRVIDGDAVMVILALAMRDAGELASNTFGGDRDEQPRAAPGHARGGHRSPHHRRRRPLRARRAEGGRVFAWR